MWLLCWVWNILIDIAAALVHPVQELQRMIFADLSLTDNGEGNVPLIQDIAIIVFFLISDV
ncbi:hypothetical protein NXW59_00135 [Bacteroides fragilis]|nr:hypothetical protein [Bacteroides fragilis]